MRRVALAWRAWWPAALAWTVLWGGMVAVFVLADGADWDERTRSLLYLAGSGALGGYMLHAGRRAVVVAACAILVAATATSLSLAWLEARAFSGSPERLTRSGVTMHGPVQRFEGIVGGLRHWAYDGAGRDARDEAQLAFEARALSSQTVVPWEATGGVTIVGATPAAAVDPTPDDDSVANVIALPGEAGTVRHFVVTEQPMGGRVFRAQVHARADDSPSADGVVGADPPRLTVGDQHGRYRQATAMPLTERWRSYEVVWTVPDDVPWTGLAVAIDGLRGTGLQLKGLRVLERVDGAWRDLHGDDARPVRLAVRLSGTETSVEVGPTWTAYTVPGGQLTPGRVEARMTVGSGHVVEVRDVRIVGGGTGLRARPLPSSSRVAFAGLHPNLIAQSVVVVFLVLMVLARSVPLRLGMAVVTLAALLPLGSRAALVGATVGIVLLLVGRYRSRLAWLVLAAGAIASVAALAISVGPAFERSSPTDVPTRPEIWRAAVDAYLTHPGEGIGTDFGAYWRKRYEGAVPVAHAHDLWLHFAASYGTPGLLAAAWLTLGSIVLAWRWGRWRGMALVIAVLAMNVVDVTLFFAGVLYPLTLGLNALREDSTVARDRPADRLVSNGGGPGVSGTALPPSTSRSEPGLGA